MNARINLVRLLGIEVGIAALVAEDVVVYAVGAKFLRDGHAKALSDVSLQHPLAHAVVDACRPRNAVEVATDVGRALHVDGVAISRRRREPVVITMYVRMSVVEADAGVQFQLFTQRPAVEGVCPEAQCLEVGDNKTPAAATVVLILAIQARAQFVVLAQSEAQPYVGRQRALVEAALQRAVGLRHVAVAHRLRAFLAQVVLIGHVGLQRPQVGLPRRMTQHLQVVHPLVGQVHVAP